MHRPVFAANWKMNHGPSDAREFLRTFLAHYARRPDRKVVFFPPAITLTTVLAAVKERHDILVGVQNIHWEDKGAFTGEVSAPIARDAGATMALVGHSERRHVFGETDAESGKKVAAAVRAGLTPVLCVGEKLEERERGETESVVLRQLRAGLADVAPNAVANMLLAYEPVWAIGTGKTATPQDASAVHLVLRDALRTIGGEKAGAVPILYGGSVNRGNASTLLAADGVGGLLVGGASLDAEGWSSIVRA
ncbi:MAG: triose-phosphate isomerase [Gemmatimonadaceae bacterium]